MAARVIGAALSAMTLASCGGLKEGNPLLLPITVPLVVGVETAMAFQPEQSFALAPLTRWTYPSWNPLETDGLWSTTSGAALKIEGRRFELKSSCGVLSGAVVQPHFLQAEYGRGYMLEIATANGDPGCIGKPDAVFQNAFVFGNRSEDGIENIVVRFYGGISDSSGKVILPCSEFFLTFPPDQQ